VLVGVVCVFILFLAVGFRAGAKDPPLDRDAVRRIRRFAEQNRREQILPYE
jgi:hypothetical protein